MKSLKWDEELPKNLEKKWRTLCSELSEVNNFNIQFKLFIMEDNEISLHVFVDASLKAYGAVAYVRYVTNDGKINISFVISKSNVASLKSLTLASTCRYSFRELCSTHFSRLHSKYIFLE